LRVELESVAPAEWDEVARGDSGATFFHLTEWARLTAAASAGARELYLVAREGPDMLGGFPVVAATRGGAKVISSMPYGTYGGPIVRDGAPPETIGRLAGAFARLARSPRVAAAHVTDLFGRLPERLGGFRARVETERVLMLDRSFDEVWAGFSPSSRNKVRKAEKSGVDVRRGRGESDFLAYHDMLVECSRRWGQARVLGSEFFLGLSRLSPGRVQMWLAVHEGRIVAGDLNFVFNGRIMNWSNVSRGEARGLAPNNLLHATAIRLGIEEGCEIYDLGSSAGVEGVEAFKAGFGGESVPFRLLSAEKPWYRAARLLARGRRKGGVR
jgi:CelD/BcsL family acetyltransferase involved in cellulose biosynthesis